MCVKDSEIIDLQLTKRQLVPILDRFLVETEWTECDPKTLLNWCLWLEKQVPDPEQFKRILWEFGVIDLILKMSIEQIKGG